MHLNRPKPPHINDAVWEAMREEARHEQEPSFQHEHWCDRCKEPMEQYHTPETYSSGHGVPEGVWWECPFCGYATDPE